MTNGLRFALWMKWVAFQSYLTHELQTDIVNRHVAKLKVKAAGHRGQIAELDRQIVELELEQEEAEKCELSP